MSCACPPPSLPTLNPTHPPTPAAGPYTSYDINTLLKATSGSRQDVQLSLRDDLVGEASRIAGGVGGGGPPRPGRGPAWHEGCPAAAHPTALLLSPEPGASLPAPCFVSLTPAVLWQGTADGDLIVPVPPSPSLTPRPAVAEAIVQSLSLDCVEGHKYAIGSTQGEGPGQDPAKWAALFRGVQAPLATAAAR